ncbi:ABC transporter [Virgisporangium aliadipatigenens]|uniref:ABC transporter n=1 Tax=Virgisporangium aliadipatigenens TaxID=741659 RepID=A0A8J4DW66_9ACTN|nr:ABC transporter permease [Virgisporangium aliadipatigenens]GIJ51928.1 ABC transporter [Virgisporangium aliadipatigenens]
MNPRYLLFEIRILIRNSRFLIFTVALPAVLFLVYSGIFGDQGENYPDGTPVRASLMVSMAAYGAMSAAFSTSSLIAVERGLGWQRQLRLTPLTGTGYLLTKTALAMLLAVPAILIVSVLGAVMGVRLDAGQWLAVTAGLWLAVLPFTVLGLVIGQFVTPESQQPVTSAVTIVLGLVGGLWIPAEVVPEWMQTIMKATPTYWLREVGHSAFAPHPAIGTAVAVLGAYAAAAALIAARRYSRDAARV